MTFRPCNLLSICLACVFTALGAAEPAFQIQPMAGQAELGTVEIHGVAAGPFDETIWKAGTLHFVPDVRAPLISPQWSGVFRNIYAPSVVETPDGWRVFYGAWDGVPTGNDRIYSRLTRDFLDFSDRRIEIEHGSFIHACNVSAVRLPDGSFRIVCTVYPDANDRNKPAVFSSPDGKSWNGSPAPYPAAPGDVVRIEGYKGFDNADINGVNVLLHEPPNDRLYFCDFKGEPHVYRASATHGKAFRYEGTCLDTGHMVNDVKKFVQGEHVAYLMALHQNGDRLWYALSAEGMTFTREQELARSLGPGDKYIVAIGWVVKDQRLLGFLYGAGAVPELNRNRIFGRWLQKKLIVTDAAGSRHEAAGALGPDRQVFGLDGARVLQGRLDLFSEDGKTRLGEPLPVKLLAGNVYRLVKKEP